MKNPNYLNGFGNQHATQAIENILPQGQNSPQKVAQGLYAEQLSGSAFTVPRHNNQRSWLYRIRPSVQHGEFANYNNHAPNFPAASLTQPPPTQMRWDPLPFPEKPTDFLAGLVTFASHGNVETHDGSAIHLYAINRSMEDYFFYNADGEFLFVPQHGELCLKTELGVLHVQPNEIAVVPRGIKFQVRLHSEQARGYICENYAAPFTLPELGPIGANGLANPRDFQYPVACFEEKNGAFKLVCKFLNSLWCADIDHSPLDVVAWHGNYAPYKYDCSHFNVINTVSFDHPDPSIFTVLTSQTSTPGVANIDFAIFPERWMVAEHTFRPPYYHRNIMNEFMGLIYGEYDAKKIGFAPGGCSLHNCMSAHGPDAQAYKNETEKKLKPEKYTGTLAFMFESFYSWKVSKFAISSSIRQKNYLSCWQELKANFDSNDMRKKSD